jgi:hypothetical protein
MTKKGFPGVMILLALMTWAACGQTQPADYRVDIAIQPVRWQALPERVQAVFVGPDQRVWYQVDPPPKSVWNLDLLKRCIELEFNKPSPQIVMARPVLFERGGRVWFTLRFDEQLLGYDGKTWVELDLNNPNSKMPTTRRVITTRPTSRPTPRPATRPVTRPTTWSVTRPTTRPAGSITIRPARPMLTLCGSLENHGTWDGGSVNLQVGHTLFFPTNLGVLTLDTQARRWVHQTMARFIFPFGPPKGPRLFADADGQGVTAVLVRSADQAIWRWREGKWTRTPVPWPRTSSPLPGTPGSEIDVMATRDGIWVGSKVSTPSFIPFQSGRPPELDAQIKQLGDANITAREHATRALEVQARFLRPWLLSAEKDADAETALRIKRILKTASADNGFQIGGNTLKFQEGLRALDDRRVLITGHGADSKYRSFVVRPGGDSIEVDPSVKLLSTRLASSALVTGDPNRIWLSRDNYDHAALLDLKTGKVVDTVPDMRYNWLQAVKGDGTLFVGPGAPSASTSSRPVMVYQPGARDDRVVTPVSAVATQRGVFCIASDGAVWTERKDMGVARFDGKRWAPVAALGDTHDVSTLLAGSNGEILFDSERGAGLISGAQILRAKTIEELIEKNQLAVAKAFPATNPGGLAAPSVKLFSDPAGNVWLTLPRGRKVFNGSGWQDLLHAASAAAGKPFQINWFMPIGDGSRVLLTDLASSRGFVLLAHVADGKLAFDQIPHTFRPTLFSPVRNRDGAIYLSGQRVKRLSQDGKVEELAVGGDPLFCDENDNLWLLQPPPEAPGKIAILKSGKMIQNLKVPLFDISDHIVGDGHGSVYVQNNTGLHRFRRKDGQYEFEKTFILTDVPSKTRAAWTSLGFLVEASSSSIEEHVLYLVDFRNDPSKG